MRSLIVAESHSKTLSRLHILGSINSMPRTPLLLQLHLSVLTADKMYRGNSAQRGGGLNRLAMRAVLSCHIVFILGCDRQFTAATTQVPSKQEQEVSGTPDTGSSDSGNGTQEPLPEPSPTPVVVPSPALPSPLPSGYSFDELLPDPYSAFVPLSPGQRTIANVHRDPRTGAAGSLGFPAQWNILKANSTVRLKILIPPGVSLVSWYVEAANMVAYLGACDESGKQLQEQSYPPTLWPVGYNSQSGEAVTPIEALPALREAKIVYLTVRSLNIDFWFLSLSVSYRVQDPGAYESWRSQRSWAGGRGDCDGLGGVYCR